MTNPRGRRPLRDDGGLASAQLINDLDLAEGGANQLSDANHDTVESDVNTTYHCSDVHPVG